MEIALVVLGVWLVASLALALLIGRALRVADRREHATTASGQPRAPRETSLGSSVDEVHESA